MAKLIEENTNGEGKTQGAFASVLQPFEQMVGSTIRSIRCNDMLANYLDQGVKVSSMKDTQLVGGALASIFAITVIFSGFRLLIGLVAWVYPIYRSGQAIKVKDAKESERWLIYWIVFAGVSTFFAYIGDVFLYWLPMYELTQVGIYVFLWHDLTDGATVLFNKYIRIIIEQSSEKLNK